MILIIGAGLTGLSTAYYLRERDYLIFERETEVGGLCRSLRIGGFTFDYTGHLLHFKNSYVKNLIDEILPHAIAFHRRDSRVYTHARYIKYPFQANLNGLPKAIARECMMGYIKAWAQREFSEARTKSHAGDPPNLGNEEKLNQSNFQQWVVENFGHGIARHFFLPYNQKLWRRPLVELSSSWASAMIPLPDLKGTLLGYFGRGCDGYGYNPTFYYPKADGIDLLPRAFLKKVKNIKLRTEVVKIYPERKEVRLGDGSIARYDALVSTVPLPELARMVEGLPEKIAELASDLKYISVYNISIGLPRRKVIHWHWAYFPEESFPFYRVGLFSNFSKAMAPEGHSSLYIEISGGAGDAYEAISDSALMEHLRQCGIVRADDELSARADICIRYAYVVFDKVRQEVLAPLQGYLNKHGIYSVGRYGAWGYHSMEDCLVEGKKTALLLNGV